MQKYRVIISGGGTGGHIFPAIAIANALKALSPSIEILFIGAEGRMEMEKVPAAGYNIKGLWISGLQRSLSLKNLSFPFKLISSLFKAKKILKQFKPDVAVGVGGYASGPMLHVAAKSGIPALLQEQNSYPGITNKLLANKVQKICVAYDGMERFFPKEKIMLTGNPVRKDIRNLDGKKARGVEYFKIDPDKKTLLIIGGSLGARTINLAIEASLNIYAENDIQVIWQTGKTYFEKAKTACVKYADKGIYAHEFISKMDYAYAVADFVVSRSGAISVSELCLVKRPVILIPSPNVAEDHQTKNAMALVVHNAALLVKDVEAIDKLGNEVLNLSNNIELQEKLKQNIAQLGKADAAEVIANEVISLIEK